MITRYTKDTDGIDELCANDATVHLERLSERDWMLIVECGEQRVHLTVSRVREYETVGVQPETGATP